MARTQLINICNRGQLERLRDTTKEVFLSRLYKLCQTRADMDMSGTDALQQTVWVRVSQTTSDIPKGKITSLPLISNVDSALMILRRGALHNWTRRYLYTEMWIKAMVDCDLARAHSLIILRPHWNSCIGRLIDWWFYIPFKSRAISSCVSLDLSWIPFWTARDIVETTWNTATAIINDLFLDWQSPIRHIDEHSTWQVMMEVHRLIRISWQTAFDKTFVVLVEIFRVCTLTKRLWSAYNSVPLAYCLSLDHFIAMDWSVEIVETSYFVLMLFFSQNKDLVSQNVQSSPGHLVVSCEFST
jgi:hypothetical protein